MRQLIFLVFLPIFSVFSQQFKDIYVASDNIGMIHFFDDESFFDSPINEYQLAGRTGRMRQDYGSAPEGVFFIVGKDGNNQVEWGNVSLAPNFKTHTTFPSLDFLPSGSDLDLNASKDLLYISNIQTRKIQVWKFLKALDFSIVNSNKIKLRKEIFIPNASAIKFSFALNARDNQIFYQDQDRQLRIYDLKTSSVLDQVLTTSFASMEDLQLDYKNNYIYWLNPALHAIYRVSFNGGAKQKVFQGNANNKAFFLDLTYNRLLISAANTIKKLDLDNLNLADFFITDGNFIENQIQDIAVKYNQCAFYGIYLDDLKTGMLQLSRLGRFCPGKRPRKAIQKLINLSRKDLYSLKIDQVKKNLNTIFKLNKKMLKRKKCNFPPDPDAGTNQNAIRRLHLAENRQFRKSGRGNLNSAITISDQNLQLYCGNY